MEDFVPLPVSSLCCRGTVRTPLLVDDGFAGVRSVHRIIVWALGVYRSIAEFSTQNNTDLRLEITVNHCVTRSVLDTI
jgi:hypothetical protein